MPFDIIGQTGTGMRQVVGFRNRFTGTGTFGGEFAARHSNQWGLYGVCVDFRSDAVLFPNYFGHTCCTSCTGIVCCALVLVRVARNTKQFRHEHCVLLRRHQVHIGNNVFAFSPVYSVVIVTSI